MVRSCAEVVRSRYEAFAAGDHADGGRVLLESTLYSVAA